METNRVVTSCGRTWREKLIKKTEQEVKKKKKLINLYTYSFIKTSTASFCSGKFATSTRDFILSLCLWCFRHIHQREKPVTLRPLWWYLKFYNNTSSLLSMGSEVQKMWAFKSEYSWNIKTMHNSAPFISKPRAGSGIEMITSRWFRFFSFRRERNFYPSKCWSK